MTDPHGLRFERSNYCNVGACVEVAKSSEGARVVRDSKEANGPLLWFTGDEWQAFIAGVKSGQFD
jgi:hypothetical protein